MPVELLISPPGTGKTDACLQRIRTLLMEHPFTPVRVVLPDRLQVAELFG
jgi:DNA polymerase III delta prime subunit